MIDTSCENLLRVPSGVAKVVPGRPHASTIWRWHRRGVRGIKLETVIIGGRRYTSREAISRFIERTTAADHGETMPTATPTKARARSIEQAEAELTEAGI